MTDDESPCCTLVEPVFKEPFCPRKYRDAKCRVFTRVRVPLREDLDRGREKGKTLESKIITRYLIVASSPFDFRERALVSFYFYPLLQPCN